MIKTKHEVAIEETQSFLEWVSATFVPWSQYIWKAHRDLEKRIQLLEGEIRELKEPKDKPIDL